jgi:hypothetical protein
MTAWSEAEPFGRTALLYSIKNQSTYKTVLYGMAWLLPTIDNEYRFSWPCAVGLFLV